MKLESLIDGVRFLHKGTMYEFRKDQQDFDGSVWQIGKVINTTRQYDLVHLITPVGFELVTAGKSWKFKNMTKLGFAYQIHTPEGEYITPITAMNDAAFLKHLARLSLFDELTSIRITTSCPGSKFPTELDTSTHTIKKQQP